MNKIGYHTTYIMNDDENAILKQDCYQSPVKTEVKLDVFDELRKIVTDLQQENNRLREEVAYNSRCIKDHNRFRDYYNSTHPATPISPDKPLTYEEARHIDMMNARAALERRDEEKGIGLYA